MDMDTIKLKAEDIERLKDLLVKDEINKLRKEFEATIQQVVEYMNEVHNQAAANFGEPVVNYHVQGGVVMGGKLPVVNRLDAAALPGNLRQPTAANLSPAVHPLAVASGQGGIGG